MARLQQNTQDFCAALKRHGIPAASESAIVPLLVGDEGRASRIAARLFEQGVFLSAIRYPTVAQGKARLRAALMATHQRDDLVWAAERIAEAWRLQ